MNDLFAWVLLQKANQSRKFVQDWHFIVALLNRGMLLSLLFLGLIVIGLLPNLPGKAQKLSQNPRVFKLALILFSLEVFGLKTAKVM